MDFNAMHKQRMRSKMIKKLSASVLIAAVLAVVGATAPASAADKGVTITKTGTSGTSTTNGGGWWPY
jgi:hypothetical protein